MRLLALLTTAALAAILAFPAATAPPPPRKTAALERQVSALRAKVTRLEALNRALGRANASALRRETALARHAAALDPCPITRPNESAPPGSTFGRDFHGNGELWVGLWRSNVVVDEREPNGAIDVKFGWWRGVPGELTIEARRLDAPAPTVAGSVPDGYGERGFQSSGVVFPAEGCWEVTGRVGASSLTFVTLVLGA